MKNYELIIMCGNEIKETKEVSECEMLKMYVDAKEQYVDSKVKDLKYNSDNSIKEMNIEFVGGLTYSYKENKTYFYKENEKDENPPTEVELHIYNDLGLYEEEADRLEEAISDALSNKYGFCHYGYSPSIKVTNIEWDIDEDDEEE